ncbi:hypothetical protein SETIT_7G295900v2 [Setaria italica]|uniref:Exocyst subunit Exo70 family protein n=1 Tax=Setaria italica TaxID=4555 RepID=A0A368S131_SETIT|nr:hypothetical protein SETIT_7G295900v2 [Setaria italica]
MEHTGPGMPEGIEELSRQASALRDALERSEENTQSMVAAIGSFDLRVSAIEASIRPVQVRTQAITMAHENIDRTIENAEAILAQFDIVRRAEAVILRGPREKLGTFLEAVDLLKGVVHFFSSNKNFKCCEGVLNQVDSLLTNSALKIEEEFRQLMDTYSKPIEPDRLFNCLPKHQLASKGDSEAVGEQPSKSFETALKNPTIIPSGILLLLHDIARQLVQDGNQQSCYRIYRDARGSALELSLRKLGIEKLSKGDIQRMQWAALKVDIGNWTHLMQIAVKVLLPGERKNCDQIFDGITFNKDQCFVELAGSSVMTLLSFGDTIAKSKRSHGNLFVLLEMYGVMHELQSEVEVVFQGKFCSEMRDAALNLTKSLAQAAQETLVDFEEAVEKDSSKTIMQNGAVHPFTIEVINYVKPLFDYQSTLKILFQQSETSGGAESYLAGVIVKIMQALQNNLNGKSKQYKDPALSHIFLMNNLHCMVMSVRRSQSKDILGGDWIQRHRKIVQQNANQYKRVAWARTLSVQATGGIGSSAPSDVSSSGVSRSMIKERFNSFNMQFEELHAKQSQWTIPDHELRDNLRLAIAEVLLPAYRSFINRFGSLVQRGKNPHKHIKHSPEALDQLLGQFFQGQQVDEQKQ